MYLPMQLIWLGQPCPILTCPLLLVWLAWPDHFTDWPIKRFVYFLREHGNWFTSEMSSLLKMEISSLFFYRCNETSQVDFVANCLVYS